MIKDELDLVRFLKSLFTGHDRTTFVYNEGGAHPFIRMNAQLLLPLKCTGDAVCPGSYLVFVYWTSVLLYIELCHSSNRRTHAVFCRQTEDNVSGEENVMMFEKDSGLPFDFEIMRSM